MTFGSQLYECQIDGDRLLISKTLHNHHSLPINTETQSNQFENKVFCYLDIINHFYQLVNILIFTVSQEAFIVVCELPTNRMKGHSNAVQSFVL